MYLFWLFLNEDTCITQIDTGFEKIEAIAKF